MSNVFLVLWFIGEHRDGFTLHKSGHFHRRSSAHNIKKLLVFRCQQLFVFKQTANYTHTQSDHNGSKKTL